MRAATEQSHEMLGSPNRKSLGRFLTAPVAQAFDFRMIFWLTLSLAFSIASASRALEQAFSSQYVLQDDARHHIFWMARFLDPDLFSQDLIADYFQAVAPLGYTTLYRAMASLGIEPLLLSKLLPMALGLITTLFCFAASMRMLPVPSAGFVSSLLLNQALWMRNDIVSSTPRAFIYPLLLAFLYFLLRRSVTACLAIIALMGLFFPSIMFISVGVLILRLLDWEKGRPSFSHDRRDYLFCAAGLAVAMAVMLPYAFKSSGFGPVVTASEARLLPEFLPGGRITVFRESFWSFWLGGKHTGMFSSSVFSPITLCLGLALPVLLRFSERFSLARRISGEVGLLPRIALASLVMFFAAHALLFRLYMPSRFTVHSFRILLALAAGASTIIMLDALFRWADERPFRFFGRPSLTAGSAVLLGVALIFYPILTGTLIDTRYKVGRVPQLYQFLARQPKDSLIASLADEADNLPIFAKRSTLVGRETALPYHKGYYGQIRQRAIDLINAHYSPDLTELQAFIQKYGVDLLLVERRAFTPDYVAGDKWINQYQPAAKEALTRLEQGAVPALSRLMKQCSIFETENMIVVQAECLMGALPAEGH